MKSFNKSITVVRDIFCLLICFALTAAISGCAPYNQFYASRQTHTGQTTCDAMYNQPYEQPSVGNTGYAFNTVQIDDYGSLWNAEEARELLARIKKSSRTTNTFVVTFIHGWHHNASTDDCNLLDSKAAIDDLYNVLSGEERSKLREATTGRKDFQLFAIYIGWRGRSLPWLLDYTTFWGRKAAAERVGEGDLSEFIQRLQRIYVHANVVADDQPHPITALVNIGHSFGAQVLWKTLEPSIEHPLIDETSRLTDVLDIGHRNKLEQQVLPIDGFGDLNILINPALEAYQFGRVDTLYRSISYGSVQTPQVVIFSATNDEARKFWFPAARWVTSLFRPRFRTDFSDAQGRLYGKALGELPEQVTHEMGTTAASDSINSSDPLLATYLGTLDFTDDLNLSGVRLVRRRDAGAEAAVPFSPIMVVRVRDNVVDGHNGIFRPDFRHFIANYISLIEAKRLLLRRVNLIRASGVSVEEAHKKQQERVKAGVM